MAAAFAPAISAQSSFEVSTIKLSLPDTWGDSYQLRGARFLSNNHTLRECIAYAYNVSPKLISGGPEWIGSQRFDIVGEASGDEKLQIDRALPMFRELLARRFQLKFHREQREMSVYNLILGKGELKLKDSAAGPGQPAGLLIHPAGFRVMRLPAHNASLADFAALLQSNLFDRPVLDRTGLAGRYDFTLEWRVEGPLSARGAPLDDDNDTPDIFAAIRGLGLRLESAKGTVEALVIDHAEKPDAN